MSNETNKHTAYEIVKGLNTQSGEKLISEAMRLLGSRKSKAKTAAARANGKKGGRPKKVKVARTSP